jgi:uncharacterized protein YjfI (DUF2170 family)
MAEEDRDHVGRIKGICELQLGDFYIRFGKISSLSCLSLKTAYITTLFRAESVLK